jgi:Family of unknown function (DUF6776)
MVKLVVKKHRPLEIVLIAVVLSAAISFLVWSLLDENHWRYIQSRFLQSEDSRFLWEVNQSLEQENKDLREQVVILERATQIDEQTAARLQNEIRTLQEQVYRQKGELEFYQGIMSSTNESKGLNIQGLHVEAMEQEGRYRFKLVLTNVGKSDKVIEVTMDMSVEGMNKSEPQVLSLNKIMVGNELIRERKFKNFERIEGSLNFPEGFKPLRAVVELKQKGFKTTVQKVFEWPVIAG